MLRIVTKGPFRGLRFWDHPARRLIEPKGLRLFINPQCAGLRLEGSGFRAQVLQGAEGLGFRLSGFKVYREKLQVQCSGCRVNRLGFRV